MRWAAFAILGIALTVGAAAWLGRPHVVVMAVVPPAAGGDEGERELDFNRLEKNLRRLSAPSSRMTVPRAPAKP